MPSSPGTLQVLRTEFTFMAWNIVSEASFKSTWPFLIIEVLAIQTKFFEPSASYTMITFTFCTTNILVVSPVAQFSLLKHKFPNLTMLHIHLCCFQITRMKQFTVNTSTTNDTTSHSLNCFSHVIFIPQTSMYYQNIAKLLTHSSNTLFFSFSLTEHNIAWY